MHHSDLPKLGFTLDDLYFINSSMPFSTRSSCQIFKKVATALNWALQQVTPTQTSAHYLDNFFMAHILRFICSFIMECFQEIWDFIGMPLASGKTVGPTQVIEFLGLLLDILKQTPTPQSMSVIASLQRL